jgi:hypothetical protein
MSTSNQMGLPLGLAEDARVRAERDTTANALYQDACTRAPRVGSGVLM